MNRQRMIANTRAFEIARELDGAFPGIRAIELDPAEFSAATKHLEKIYNAPGPTFEPPTVKHIPRAFEEHEVRTMYDIPLRVFASPAPDHREMIIQDPTTGHLLKYRRYRRADATKTPIIDTYYLTRITRGTWYYYMPAGREYELYDSSQDYVTATHYAINWDKGIIIDYPFGSTVDTSETVANNPRKLRAAVLATLINPRVFNQVATNYLQGKMDVQKLNETYKQLAQKLFSMNVSVKVIYHCEP